MGRFHGETGTIRNVEETVTQTVTGEAPPVNDETVGKIKGWFYAETGTIRNADETIAQSQTDAGGAVTEPVTVGKSETGTVRNVDEMQTVTAEAVTDPTNDEAVGKALVKVTKTVPQSSCNAEKSRRNLQDLVSSLIASLYHS